MENKFAQKINRLLEKADYVHNRLFTEKGIHEFVNTLCTEVHRVAPDVLPSSSALLTASMRTRLYIAVLRTMCIHFRL